ncbi:MAG: hypothetical protein IJN47_07495, partial [Clostridia bacterium]|nr:hypothetical protein [Clostridia bacterium]
TEFRFPDWDVTNVTAIAYMFQGCSSEALIYAPDWNYAGLEKYEGYLDDIWYIAEMPWADWFAQQVG